MQIKQLTIGWMSLGDSYFDLAEYEKAVEYLNKSLECHSTNISINEWYGQIWDKLGDSYSKLDMLDKSVECYHKAIEFYSKMNPEDKNALGGLATVYAKLNDYDKASEYLNKIKELYPAEFQKFKGISSSSVIAVILIESNQYDKAIEYCNKILEQNPENGDAWAILAMTYMKLGNTEKVLDCLHKALEFNSKIILAAGGNWNVLGER